VYFVINFGVFFILNTGLEVKIVRRMHKELKEKRERIAKMKAFSSLAGTAKTSQADEERKKVEEEDEKKERSLIKMVVLNGVLNFIFRAPDMLFWMENKSLMSDMFSSEFLSFNDGDFSNQNIPGLLNLIADIGYLTYIFTFTTNFLIFYNFNKNFKKAVKSSWI
jgi:hypothetical protein